MRCSNCGREIAPFDAKLDTRNVSGGNPRMSAGGTTKTLPIWLCPDCTRSREGKAHPTMDRRGLLHRSPYSCCHRQATRVTLSNLPAKGSGLLVQRVG